MPSLACCPRALVLRRALAPYSPSVDIALVAHMKWRRLEMSINMFDHGPWDLGHGLFFKSNSMKFHEIHRNSMKFNDLPGLVQNFNFYYFF